MKKIYASKEWIDKASAACGYEATAKYGYYGMPIVYVEQLKGNIAYIFDDNNKNVETAIKEGLRL